MCANASKNDKVGSRQVQKAEELHRAGLLSRETLAMVQSSWHQLLMGEQKFHTGKKTCAQCQDPF
jgi:hypothetical protein